MKKRKLKTKLKGAEATIGILLRERRQMLDALEHAADDVDEGINAAIRMIELEKVIERFLEWDTLTVLPDPLPAPFGDLPYWIAEFRSALKEKDAQG